MVGVTHVSEVEFSLSSCVCVWVEGCSYAIPQHTHVHLSYSGSGLASPDGWSGEDGSRFQIARWQLVGQQCVEMHQTRQGPGLNIHQSMIGLCVGTLMQKFEDCQDYFDICRPRRGLVHSSGLAEPLNVRPTT